jgi:hypothetical protein
MQFLNPLVLFGLAASAIPLIIHLLNLRKIKTIEFSSLKFLNELQKSSIKKMKIKQILLLIIRTLLLIFLILAFARPSVKSHLPILGSYSKTSAIILIDNSYSMDVSDEFGNRFNQAKSVAKSIIKNLKEGDEAGFVLLSPNEANAKKSLTRNLKLIDNELNSVNINNFSGNYINSLSKIQTLLEDSKNLVKEVYIISDFQKSNIKENLDSLKFFDNNTIVYLVPIGGYSKSEIQNLSIDSIKIASSIFQKNKPVETEFSVINLSNKQFSGIVASNYLNKQKLAQRSFDITSNESKMLNISSIPSVSGLYNGYIELENDALEQDNKRYYGFILPEKPKSAIIGSDASIKYLKIILNLDIDGQNPTEILANREISSIDLSRFDVVYFTGPFKKSDFAIIKQYTENGGGAFIFANSDTDPQVFIDGMNNIGLNVQQSTNNNQEISIRKVDKMHPLFSNVFKNPADEKLQIESPKFNKFYKISGGQNIINMDNGSILSEIKNKNGKILVFGSSTEEKWSNIAVSSIFPTIVYRSLYYLSSKELRNLSIHPQYSYLLEIPSKLAISGKFKMVNPDNSESFYNPAQIGDKYIIELTNLNKFGNYILYNSLNQIVSILSVNPENLESKIDKYSSDDTKKWFTEISNSGTKIEEIKEYNDINKSISRAKAGTELWQIFVILAIVMALLELLIQRMYKNE